MRKDGKSQYQIKKEKLLKIKNIIKDLNNHQIRIEYVEYEGEIQENKANFLKEIWELVKDEKDND